MDITQIILMVSVTLVTIVIVVSGIWLVLLLKELKITIIKTNSILDDTKSITSSIAEPVASISEFINGFRNGMNFFTSLFKKKEE